MVGYSSEIVFASMGGTAVKSAEASGFHSLCKVWGLMMPMTDYGSDYNSSVSECVDIRY